MLAAYVQQQMRDEVREQTGLERRSEWEVASSAHSATLSEASLTDADTAELTARINRFSSSQVQVQQLAWGDLTPSTAALVGRVSLLL